MKTTATQRPASLPKHATSRLDYAAAIYRRVRCEKDPPLARYSMLLALARRNGSPATGLQIGKDIGQGTAPNGTIDAALRHGLIALGPPSDTGTTRYTLTPAGVALVQDLLQPAIHPLA
jgi:hypothetical protein